MVDVIFDRSAFHGNYFDQLQKSQLQLACRRGLIRVRHTPVFLHETFSMYDQPASRAELLRQLPFTLSIANGGMFRTPGEILHDELVRGRGPHARMLYSPAELVQFDLMAGDPFNTNGHWNGWQAACQERRVAYQKKSAQKQVYTDVRQGVGQMLKAQGHHQPLGKFRFSEHLKNTLEESGRAIIAAQVPSQNLAALQNRWARDMKRFPFMTTFAEGFVYAGYYAAIEQNGPIDRNAQPDYEQMVFMHHANILVSNDTRFQRAAFDALWKQRGKVLMNVEQFLSFVNRIA